MAGFKTNRLAFLETYTAGSIYLIGEFSNSSISDLTYNSMWSNQKLSLKYDRDDFVLEHWKNAHQYYDMSLEPINHVYGHFPEVLNQADIDKRKKEREQFFVFHTVLGALMLYTGKYETLSKIFGYSQSIPPRYVLLPEHIETIFRLYIRVTDTFDQDFDHIAFKYPFPDMHGIQADEKINQEIAAYLALLFLRQYSIVPYLVYQKPLALPAIPPTMGEKKKWLEAMPYFKKLVKSTMENAQLLKATRLDFISPAYCESRHLRLPLELIDDFRDQLQNAIQAAEINQDISPDIRQRFIDTTKEILSSTFESYKELIREEPLTGETSGSYLNGEIQVIDRSSIADNQGFVNLNVHSIVAERLSQKFRRWISECFFVMKKDRYLFRSDEVVNVLDKLNLTEKDACIISFWNEFKGYEGIKTISYNYSNRRLIGDAIFIVSQDDLPSVQFKKLNDDLIQEYSLERIDDLYNMYASLINLNENEHLHEDVFKSGFDGDIRKQALIAVFIYGEFRWRTNGKCIMIQVLSPYREEGITTKIGEVKEF